MYPAPLFHSNPWHTIIIAAMATTKPTSIAIADVLFLQNRPPPANRNTIVNTMRIIVINALFAAVTPTIQASRNVPIA